MKNPSTTNGAGAFRVTSTATFASPVDAMRAPVHASNSDARFYWDRDSNSVQPLTAAMGRVRHG
jgi:hypothetical protein